MRTRSLGYSSGHISNVEGGHVTPSADLLEVYIQLGAPRDEVVALLGRLRVQSADQQRRARLAGRADSGRELPSTPLIVTSHTAPDTVRSHYTVERYDVDFVLDNRGALRSVTSDVAIRALSANVSLYYTGHSPNARAGTSPNMGVEPVDGCTIDRINRTVTGSADVYLRLTEPISPVDAPARLSYRLDLDGSERADPNITYHTRQAYDITSCGSVSTRMPLRRCCGNSAHRTRSPLTGLQLTRLSNR